MCFCKYMNILILLKDGIMDNYECSRKDIYNASYSVIVTISAQS